MIWNLKECESKNTYNILQPKSSLPPPLRTSPTIGPVHIAPGTRIPPTQKRPPDAAAHAMIHPRLLLRDHCFACLCHNKVNCCSHYSFRQGLFGNSLGVLYSVRIKLHKRDVQLMRVRQNRFIHGEMLSCEVRTDGSPSHAPKRSEFSVKKRGRGPANVPPSLLESAL